MGHKTKIFFKLIFLWPCYEARKMSRRLIWKFEDFIVEITKNTGWSVDNELHRRNHWLSRWRGVKYQRICDMRIRILDFDWGRGVIWLTNRPLNGNRILCHSPPNESHVFLLTSAQWMGKMTIQQPVGTTSQNRYFTWRNLNDLAFQSFLVLQVINKNSVDFCWGTKML